MDDSYEIVDVEEKKKGTAWKYILTAVVFTIIGTLLAGCRVTSDSTAIYEGKHLAEVQHIAVDTDRLLTASEIYATYASSTVGITTEVTTNFFGYETTTPASGSGFIVSADGYVVTNFHVIESSSSISVSLYNGEVYPATVVGYDESSDIAVLKIEAEGLSPVILGDSSLLNVGDQVLAIGNPLGELTFSLTSGTVSAVDREVTLYNSSMNLIQTDCAINSGNSGGALFNMYGEVIGITNAKYSSSGDGLSIDNIAFAIPINSVKDVITSIIENGCVVKPYIGVMVSDVSETYLEMGIPEGALIASLTEDGPAEKAGLKVNDIITAINGNPISGYADLKKAIAESEIGDFLTLTIYRKGETTTVSVEVSEYRQETNQQVIETKTQQSPRYFMPSR